MLIEFKGMRPQISDEVAFVADEAVIAGDVRIGKGSSVWFFASIRAEVDSITIGECSNVQDHCMLHADYDCPIRIGDRVSIGHNAIVHGATIEDDTIVGMGAIVMNGAVVGEGSRIAAGALVAQNKVIPPYSLVVGVPGKVVKTLEKGSRPQEGNDEVYTADALEYAQRKIVG